MFDAILDLLDIVFGTSDAVDAVDVIGGTDVANAAGQTDGVQFGNGVNAGRFDIPGAVSGAGNPVASTASGTLFDTVTGEELSKN